MVKLVQSEEKVNSNNNSNNNQANNDYESVLCKLISQYKEYQVDALHKTIDHKYKQNLSFKTLVVEKINEVNKLLQKSNKLELSIKQSLSYINIPVNLNKQVTRIISEVRLRKLFDLQFETLTDCLNKLILNTEIQRRKK